ncbi:MAG TPA: hypothetical protein VGO40_25290 [Longimicrobium sp.]|jgi:hypothetical protein|nr:hypothetical protein [Longimicrobium sp.]
MKLHLMEARQNLPVPIREAWDFVADARKLARLREVFAYRLGVLEQTFGACKA